MFGKIFFRNLTNVERIGGRLCTLARSRLPKSVQATTATTTTTARNSLAMMSVHVEVLERNVQKGILAKFLICSIGIVKQP